MAVYNVLTWQQAIDAKLAATKNHHPDHEPHGLTNVERMLVFALMPNLNPEGVSYPSLVRLAKKCGSTTPTMKAAGQSLLKKGGWFTEIRQPHRDSKTKQFSGYVHVFDPVIVTTHTARVRDDVYGTADSRIRGENEAVYVENPEPYTSRTPSRIRDHEWEQREEQKEELSTKNISSREPSQLEKRKRFWGHRFDARADFDHSYPLLGSNDKEGGVGSEDGGLRDAQDAEVALAPELDDPFTPEQKAEANAAARRFFKSGTVPFPEVEGEAALGEAA